jgi:hypothetical protein
MIERSGRAAQTPAISAGIAIGPAAIVEWLTGVEKPTTPAWRRDLDGAAEPLAYRSTG